MKPRIVLTGGGSAGHVTPNLALIEALEPLGWRIDYIGSQQGIERNMVEREGIPYHQISTGKFRRYWTWKNFAEPFKVIKGIGDAFRHLKRIKPQVVFSKGGFVAFPVVFGAWLLRIPVVAHESDLTPGLANRLSYPFVSKLCVSFAGAVEAFKSPHKLTVTGSPIRSSLFQGKPNNALRICSFKGDKPILLVVGGSLGAQRINAAIRALLPNLTSRFHVIHLCGQGKLDVTLKNNPDYYQCEYAHHEMADFLAASSLVLSRAGSNAVYELLALAKPHILIPLSANASRGDQIENAHYFEKQGVSIVLSEKAMSADKLLEAIETVYQRLPDFQKKIKSLNIDSATQRLIEVLESILAK